MLTDKPDASVVEPEDEAAMQIYPGKLAKTNSALETKDVGKMGHDPPRKMQSDVAHTTALAGNTKDTTTLYAAAGAKG